MPQCARYTEEMLILSINMFAGYRENSVMKDRTTILSWLTATLMIANGKINIIHILFLDAYS